MSQYGINVPPGIPVFKADDVAAAATKMADNAGEVRWEDQAQKQAEPSVDEPDCPSPLNQLDAFLMWVAQPQPPCFTFLPGRSLALSQSAYTPRPAHPPGGGQVANPGWRPRPGQVYQRPAGRGAHLLGGQGVAAGCQDARRNSRHQAGGQAPAGTSLPASPLQHWLGCCRLSHRKLQTTCCLSLVEFLGRPSPTPCRPGPPPASSPCFHRLGPRASRSTRSTSRTR